MKAYELLFFTNPALDEESRLGLMKRLETLITGNGGTVDNVDQWGKRKLAYEIDKLADGDYTLIDFHIAPETVAEIGRVIRINDLIVRHMITCRTDRD